MSHYVIDYETVKNAIGHGIGGKCDGSNRLISVLIVVGTQSGNAAMVGDTMKTALIDAGIACETMAEDNADPALIARHKWLLVCCSTHGDGDVPDHLLPLLAAIRQQQPDLSHVRYGAVGLGDRTYHETYCHGVRQIDELLQAHGAQRVGEPLQIDASTQPFADEVAAQWLGPWLAMAAAAAPDPS